MNTKEGIYIIGAIASIIGLIIIITPSLLEHFPPLMEHVIKIPVYYKIFLFFFLSIVLIFLISKLLSFKKRKIPISIKDDHVIYTIKDSKGKLVSCEKNQFIRANMDFITTYEEEIATDGEIENFKGSIEGVESWIIPPSKKAGLKWKIRHVFYGALPKGKYIRRTFSFDFIDSFTEKSEYIWLSIRNDVGSFVLSIIFPADRHPGEVKKFLKREPVEMKIDPPICPYTLPDGRKRVDWSVNHPRINDIYIMRWDW